MDIVVKQEDLKVIYSGYEGNFQMSCSVETSVVMKIFLRSVLKCFGDEYKIIKEKRKSDEIIFFTNLPSEKLKTLDSNIEIKVNFVMEEIGDIFIEQERYDVNYEKEEYGKMIFVCGMETLQIDMVLLNSLLKKIGDKYKVLNTEVDDFFDERCYTNLPLVKLNSTDPEDICQVVVNKEDIRHFSFREIDEDQNIEILLNPSTYFIDRILIRSILKSYGEDYKIEEVRYIPHKGLSYFITNLPYGELRNLNNCNPDK